MPPPNCFTRKADRTGLNSHNHMLLHIPPPSTDVELINAALYLVTGFAAGILTALGFLARRKRAEARR